MSPKDEYEETEKFFKKSELLWSLVDEVSKKKRELRKELAEFEQMFKREQEKGLPDNEATLAKVLIDSAKLEI